MWSVAGSVTRNTVPSAQTAKTRCCGYRPSACAAAVATSPRSFDAGGLPRVWIEFVSSTTYVVRARVDPHAGAREARVAEATDGKDPAPRHRLARIDVPAEAAQVLSPDRRIVRRQQRVSCVGSRGCSRSASFAASICPSLCPGCCGVVINCSVSCVSGIRARPPRQPVEQRLRVDADIVSRREHPGMPGHSAHPPCRRVVHRAAQQVIDVGILVRLRSVFLVTRCRRDARQQTRCSTCRRSTQPARTPCRVLAHAIAAPLIECGPHALAAGRYRVSVMPSGAKMFCCT